MNPSQLAFRALATSSRTIMDNSVDSSRQGVGAPPSATSSAPERVSVEPFPPAAAAGAAPMMESGAMPAREASQTVGASLTAGLVFVQGQAAGAQLESTEAFVRAQYIAPGEGVEHPLNGNTGLGEGGRAGREEQRAGGSFQDSALMAPQQEDAMLVCQEGEGDSMVLSQPAQQQQQQQDPSAGADTAKELRLQSLHEGYARPPPLACFPHGMCV